MAGYVLINLLQVIQHLLFTASKLWCHQCWLS